MRYVNPAVIVLGLCLLVQAEPTTTQSDKQTVTVKRGTIVATVEADGYFEPIVPLEVRVRPLALQGEMRVKSAAAQGSIVRKGELILEADSAELVRQLATAQNELTAARANLAKAQADDALGEQGHALALKIQENELANAEGALKWWEQVDGNQMLKQAELASRNARNNVEDQSDELDQLKKMYKTEDLTKATADIVIKRAVRSLETATITRGLMEARETKVRSFDYDAARQRLVFAIDQQRQQLAQLKAQQEHSKTQRKTAVGAARVAVHKAEARVAELEADLGSFSVRAPADGVVYYGQLVNGAWQNASPRLLRDGDKINPAQVLMTFAEPGKLRLVAEVPEAKLSMVCPGQAARVVAVAVPQAACDGRCGSPEPAGFIRDGSQVFRVPIELARVDPRLMPGMKASVRIDAGAAENVLLVPAAAVSKGRVKMWVNDQEQWRDVVTGKTDGEVIQIIQGLEEGDQILPKVGK